MLPTRDRVVTLARAIVHEVRAENLTFMAGSIAYHAFLSLLPILVLVLAAISTFGDQSLVDAFLRLTQSVLTRGAGEVIVDELSATRGSLSASIIGGAVLIWGTLRIFRGLDQAFSDIYESEAENTFLDQVGDGVVVLGTFAVAILGGVVVNSVFPATGDPLLSLVRRLLFVGGLVVTFLPMYYIFPDSDVTVREIVPGVVLAAVGLTLFESVFQFYLSYRNPDEAGVVTGIVLLLTWLYFSGLVILLGAVVNAVLANRSADVNVDPVFGGVTPTEKRAERDRLLRQLRQLQARLGDGRRLSVAVDDDDAVVLDAPTDAEVSIGDSAFADGAVQSDGDVELRLRWRTGADADDQ
ncbi:YihY/virulence factor BrkB family protein [Salinirubrum litoreum]|uniref:YihY/virulence factor BrkB family protein n=1 Tax=Salinirubrum litoreum TaxID=1126234 RepID=A0ABD5R770_9EURY|nr:YihY/virulence factor BrkB family protein [Salinirubrum litoreum]